MEPIRPRPFYGCTKSTACLRRLRYSSNTPGGLRRLRYSSSTPGGLRRLRYNLRLGEDGVDNVAVDVGQTVVATAMAIGETFMVNSH